MALQPITGLPSSHKYPGQWAEILFAQGPSTAAASTRSVIFVMPITSAGTWTANTVYSVKDEAEARSGAGAGSPLHRAIRKFLLHNRSAKIYALPYAATSGGSPVAATSVVTVTNAATATGSATVTVCGEECSAGFKSGDSVTTIGDALEAAINAKVHLPVTAANVAGTITVTAKIAGISQGDGTIPVISLRSEITTGVGTTISDTGALGISTGVDGVEGSTTEAANFATALATISSARYYYMVTSLSDATSLASLKSHISSKSEPNPGLRSVGISGFTGALTACATIATGLNYERHQIVWQLNGDHDNAELAANVAAIRQKREEVDSAANLNLYAGSDWGIRPSYAQADWPDSDDLNDAVTDGISPVSSNLSGSQFGMNVTTSSKASGGSLDDWRATEAHRVSVMDEITDTYLLRWQLQWAGKKLRADVTLDDGVTVNPNQKKFSGVVTPSLLKPWFALIAREFYDAGKLQDLEGTRDSLAVNIDPLNSARVELGGDFRSIDHLNQGTFRLAEVSPG